MHAIQTTGSDLRYGYIGFDFDSSTHDTDIVALKRFYESTKVFFRRKLPRAFSAAYQKS